MKNEVDLGKYDLNQLLRNPGLVHSIQDALMKIEGTGAFTRVIRDGAKTDINECIKMIVAQYPHNPKMIIKIVGKKTLEMIEEFSGVTLADNIPGNLFSGRADENDKDHELLNTTDK